MASADTKKFLFHYVRNSVGTIDGQSVLTQTEDAINEVVEYTYQIVANTEEALRIANQALTTADSAQSAATAAVNTANSALSQVTSLTTVVNSWNERITTAESNSATAVSTANEAKANSETAIKTADTAVTTADSALELSTDAVTTAGSALDAANHAVNVASDAQTTASEAKQIAQQAVVDTEEAVEVMTTLKDEATTQANNAKTSAQDSASSASQSSANADLAKKWATWTAGTEAPDDLTAPLDYTVDGYEYSAKWYAEQAKASASGAETSATTATSAASAAEESATAAKSSEDAAKTSETNAGKSQDAAAKSATAAEDAALYKITVTETGAVSTATAVTKADITALGIPAQDTTYGLASATADGLMSKADFAKLEGIAAGAQANVIEAVSVNGNALPINSKGVNIDLSGYALKADFTSVLSWKGTVATFTDLPADAAVGDTYNIGAAFDLDGQTYPAGTNVARTSGDTPTWDPLGGSFSVTAVATADIDALFA